MICKVRNTVKKYSMPLKNKTVVVGVSGGADSMALLHVLYNLKDEYNIQLVVCHLNHSIRGEDADSDEMFVKNACEKLGVECRTLKLNIPEMSKKQGISEEECGRNARYAFFNSVGEDIVIATAHTLSDRAETLIFNLTRGSSTRGLASIPAVRDNIVRPLIECTRDEIETFCAENKIDFVTDKTNFEDIYTRNNIRLNVIPQLKKINPSFEKSIARLSESVSVDEGYFNEAVADLLVKAKADSGYDADMINSAHAAIKRRAIVSLLKSEADIIPEFIHIKMVEDILSGGRTEILRDTVVEVKNNTLTVNPEKTEFTEWVFSFDNFTADTPAGKYTAKIINKNDLPPKQIVHNKVLDYDCIKGSLTLRNRRAGDKFRMAGSNCTKTLKKLFNEKKIEDRNNCPVLVDDEGVVWVQGIGCCDRCKITDNTTNILLINKD